MCLFFRLSLCSMSPWTWETIKLVADQRASLAGHKHFRHIKCGATLLASPHLHTVSPRFSSSKLDQIGQRATEKGGRMARISPLNNFLKGLTSNTSMIHFTTGVVLEWLWTLVWVQWPNSEERDEVEFNIGAEKGEWSRRESCETVQRLRKTLCNILSQTMKGKTLCLWCCFHQNPQESQKTEKITPPLCEAGSE